MLEKWRLQLASQPTRQNRPIGQTASQPTSQLASQPARPSRSEEYRPGITNQSVGHWLENRE